MGEGQGRKKVKEQNSRAASVVVLVQITEISYRAVGHSASILLHDPLSEDHGVRESNAEPEMTACSPTWQNSRAARIAAAIYSLIGTAKLNGSRSRKAICAKCPAWPIAATA